LRSWLAGPSQLQIQRRASSGDSGDEATQTMQRLNSACKFHSEKPDGLPTPRWAVWHIDLIPHEIDCEKTYFQFLEPNAEALICFLDIFESNVGCP